MEVTEIKKPQSSFIRRLWLLFASYLSYQILYTDGDEGTCTNFTGHVDAHLMGF